MRSFWLHASSLLKYSLRERGTFIPPAVILGQFARLACAAHFAKMPRAVRGKLADVPLAMCSPYDQSLKQVS